MEKWIKLSVCLFFLYCFAEHIIVPETVFPAEAVSSESYIDESCEDEQNNESKQNTTSKNADMYSGLTPRPMPDYIKTFSVVLSESCMFVSEDYFQQYSQVSSVTVKNPDCEFYDSELTIPDTAVIYGYPGSTAQVYSEKYSRKFVELEINPQTAEAYELKKGDLSGDGNIDIQDLVILNKAILGKTLISEAQLKCIDFNENGKPDVEEMLLLLKYIIGLEDI